MTSNSPGEGKGALMDVQRIRRRWAPVKPGSVVGGSDAQSQNVLADALSDIRTLADEVDATREKLVQLFDGSTNMVRVLTRDLNATNSRVRRLEAALRVCRGWVLTCSESAQARRDLVTLDRALERPIVDAVIALAERDPTLTKEESRG